ncbi:MAG: hypothetical protein JSR56_12100 [Proteobacteria bacterium]|nr:hypothetical protein [Pseudomonadota bacterium]
MAACLLCACACAQAAVRMQAATLELPGISLSGVHLTIAVGSDGRPQARLDAASVSVPSLGWRDVALALRGEPQKAGGNTWRFVGKIETKRAPGSALADADLDILYDPDGGTLEVDVQQGKTRLQGLLPLDQTTHVQMTLTALPLAWLRGVLAAAWPDGRLNGGSVAGSVALDLAPGGSRVSGRVDVADVELDSKAGNIAAQKLAASGSFRVENGLASGIMFDGDLQGGQLLLGPLYAQLPAHPVNLHVAATLGLAGIAIDKLDFNDGDALQLAGSLGFDRKGNLDKLTLSRFAASFPAAYTRYGTTLVQGLTGFKQLDMTGNVNGSLDLSAGGLKAFQLAATNVAIDSRGGGIEVAGLNGNVDWRARTSRPATTLAWNALALYRVVLGPATLALEDQGGTLVLDKPVSVPVLGGAFLLDRLAWRPDADKAQRLSASFAVTDVDVPELCKAFGWPAFGGKLGGAVPDLTYHGDDLVFGGGLSLNMFGGSVSVTHLGLRHPFGATPELAADIDLQQLDLGQITSVFDFGQITGRMDGSVHGLQLVGWKPVAFKADLTAGGGGRISQHAIKSLTEVGGGGIAGGLQGMALRLFKTFGYARIGLSCVLADGVCAMGGINPDPDPDSGGYTIVEGSGLPRITVIGHQHAVDWATLVNRLKAATEGSGPVIN